MDSLSVAQAMCAAEQDVGTVEMFPSSAVAQTHVPGSASIATLDPPPPHHNPSSLSYNQRETSALHDRSDASTIATNPDSHLFSGQGEVSVRVNLVEDRQPQQDKTINNGETYPVQQGSETITATMTATTTPVMMVDDPEPAPNVGSEAVPPANAATGDEKVSDASTKAPDVNGSEANNGSAVRKVR